MRLSLEKNDCENIVQILLKDKTITNKICAMGHGKKDDIDNVLKDIKKYCDEILKPCYVNDRNRGYYCLCQKRKCYKFFNNKNVKIILSTLSRCNADCINCIANDKEYDLNKIETEMNFTKKIVAELAKRDNVKIIELSGSGECTIYNLDEILKQLTKDEVRKITLLTNGSNTEVLRRILDIYPGIKIRISIPSVRKQMYEQITKLKTFDKLMNFLETNKIKENIQIGFVIHQETECEIEEVYNLIFKRLNYKLCYIPDEIDLKIFNKYKDIYLEDKYHGVITYFKDKK